MKSISIIIPCYNEGPTVAKLVKSVIESDTLGLAKEIIVINDGSTDDSLSQISHLRDEIRLLDNAKNQGKGSVIRQGLTVATGDIIIIQDADLEYSPLDYAALIRPIVDRETPVVYGVRQRNHFSAVSRCQPFYVGSYLINLFANILYGTSLADIHTGYKVFLRSALAGVTLESTRFEICHELTAFFLKNKFHIVEVPIRYTPRSFKDGKKISWRDGVRGCWVLLKKRVIKDRYL